MKKAIMLKTNSKRKAAPNWEAGDIKKASKMEALIIGRGIMRKNETPALVNVTGKIIFTVCPRSE